RIALEQFGRDTDAVPSCRMVYVENEKGEYHKVWHVELLSSSIISPARMNYMIEVERGEVVDAFNQVDNRVPHAHQHRPPSNDGDTHPVVHRHRQEVALEVKPREVGSTQLTVEQNVLLR